MLDLMPTQPIGLTSRRLSAPAQHWNVPRLPSFDSVGVSVPDRLPLEQGLSWKHSWVRVLQGTGGKSCW